MANQTPTSTDEPLAYNDIRHTDRLVRDYGTPPGDRLYAYRNGDEHVIISNGSEPNTRWTKRVPAERDRLAPGEQLWTIPDNWEQRVHVTRESIAYGLYYNDDLDIWAKISIPTHDWLVDAWYAVKSVGELDVETADDLGDRSDALAVADDFEAAGHKDDAEAFRTIANNWSEFEREQEMATDWVRSEGLWGSVSGDVPVRLDEDWTAEFQQHIFKATNVLDQATDIDDCDIPTARAVEELRHRDLLPDPYRFRVGIDSSDVSMQYHIRALVEAGCSPSEALDYHMVEVVGLSQTEWAEERGIEQPSVSANVSNADRTLKF